MTRFSPVTWLMFGLTTLAVAGVVHIVTVLALPYRAPDDAFRRIAAVTSPNAMVRPSSLSAIPFRDPVMGEAFCRYDLRNGPLRITIGPFDRGFLSIGFHSRHGVAFYGMTIRSSDTAALSLVLQAPGFEAPEASDEVGPEPNRDIPVKAPERDGFIAVQTPIGEGEDPGSVADILGHVACAPDEPAAH